ncbi:MAG: response regulator transcription factor, partial [Solirubrobacterales bacterium]|nr:response regulator transcription factor [Solirubrobacterales bacterium]
MTERLAAHDGATSLDSVGLYLVGMAAHAVGDYARACRALAGAAKRLRAEGRRALLAQALTMNSWDTIHLGGWPTASVTAVEAAALASGERSRRRVAESRTDLSPQELQIARMAASGLSNREISHRLYLSPRTIA